MRRMPPAGGIHSEISLPHTDEWELEGRPLTFATVKLRGVRGLPGTQILELRCANTRQGIADLKHAKSADTRLREALEGA